MNSVRDKPKTMFVSSHRPWSLNLLNWIYTDLVSNVSKLYPFAILALQVPKIRMEPNFWNTTASCYLANRVKSHSHMSKKIKTWNMARPNRLNCVVHIRHLVRVPGTRSSRKTFGVYPSTFSTLEDHRVYRCIYRYIPLYIPLYTRWAPRKKKVNR